MNTVRPIIQCCMSRDSLHFLSADKESALRFVCREENRELVVLLLQHDTLINAGDSKGKTALMLACANDHKDVAVVLVDKGADMNTKGSHLSRRA